MYDTIYELELVVPNVYTESLHPVTAFHTVKVIIYNTWFCDTNSEWAVVYLYDFTDV